MLSTVTVPVFQVLYELNDIQNYQHLEQLLLRALRWEQLSPDEVTK